jgi:hypothetical protein
LLFKEVTSKNFAGLFVDQKSSGTVNILITKPINEYGKVVENIQSIFGSKDVEDKLLFVNARYNLQELENLHNDIFEDFDLLKSKGVPIIKVGIDIPFNRVKVEVEEMNDQVEEILANHYNINMLKITEGEPIELYRSTWNGYLEAGLHLNRRWFGDDSTPDCTSNLSVKKNNSIYLLTAGHCPNVEYKIGTQFIGTKFSSESHFGDNVDAGFVRVGNSSWGTSWLYVLTTKSRNISSYQKYYEDYVGQYVCYSGARTGYNCGRLTSFTESYTINGVQFYGMREVDIGTATHGDSGAPFFYNFQIRGVLQGGNNSITNYSHIDHVRNKLGFTFLFE